MALVLQDRATDGIIRITLNNPDRRHALSQAMLEGLHGALDGMRGDRDARVVLLRANGPVFSAGHDLRELASATPEATAGLFRTAGDGAPGGSCRAAARNDTLKAAPAPRAATPS